MVSHTAGRWHSPSVDASNAELDRELVGDAPDARAGGRAEGALVVRAARRERNASAKRFGDWVRRVAELYREHFAVLGLPADRVRDIATRSHEALRAWAPSLAEESDACADAAGVERWTVAAVGARTEILAGCPSPRKGECSTAVFAPGGAAPQTVQTWDWHDLLVPDALLHELTPSQGRKVKLFTEFGAPGKIGVNSAGLGVHFNISSTRRTPRAVACPCTPSPAASSTRRTPSTRPSRSPRRHASAPPPR